MQEPVMVSIRCTVYNHEPYIRQCLEGFVMQKTNFRFEAIVHDDASTDGSALIIREFAEKYPDIIKPIYETENQYSKHDGSLSRIMNAQTRGKYVALCEGDDYWIDPNKLQMQVDFLEGHPDYTMCFHKVDIEADEEFLRHQYDQLQEKEYFSDEILNNWMVPTCSTMFAKKVMLYIPLDDRFICGDIVWFLTAANCGRIYCLSNVMGVYRRLSTGMTAVVLGQEINTEKWVCHYQALAYHFPKVQKEASYFMALQMVRLLRIYWEKDMRRCVALFFKFVNEGGWCFIKRLLAWFKHLIMIKNRNATE